MATKLISFDLDDTLWPVLPTLKAAELKTWEWLQAESPAFTERYSLKDIANYRIALFRDNPDLQSSIAGLRKRSIAELAMQAGMDEAAAQQLSLRAFEVHYQLRQQVEPFPGTREILEELSQHYLLVAITNGNADIYTTQLGEFFVLSVSAESEGVGKPDPVIFSNARQKAEQLTGQSLPESSVVHVGDSLLHDVQGAKQVGFAAVWFQHHSLVEPGQRHRYELDNSNSLLKYPEPTTLEEHELARADAEITDLSELPAVLASLD